MRVSKMIYVYVMAAATSAVVACVSGDDSTEATANDGGNVSQDGSATDANISSGDGRAPNGDGGKVTDGSVATASFTLSLSVPSIVVDPGTTSMVTATIVRSGGFTGEVDLALSGAPDSLTSTATIASGETTAMLSIAASNGAETGQAAAATVSATGGGVATQTAPLFIRVGHTLLVANASTTFTVPSDATTITIEAWGAGGGGAGGGPGILLPGYNGGAGGFEQADVTFTAGQTLSIVVGAPGQPGAGGIVSGSAKCGGAGGGGGYTGVFKGTSASGFAPSAYVLIAGAGGGGTCGSASAAAGGGGGGASGGAGAGGNGVNPGGAPGTQAAGGATSGAQLTGGTSTGTASGTGGGAGGAGGTPGGGTGLSGNDLDNGGGGAGYYGGGGGYFNQGGGGGSSFAVAAATNVVNVTASTTTTPPHATDPNYGNSAGLGGGGAPIAGSGVLTGVAGTIGGPGRVVILIPKAAGDAGP